VLLAQCGTLIAHRTVNPLDQDLVRGATPTASRDILRQLPGLATQHAVVMGESAPVPAHVRIRDVRERPGSADPAFMDLWRVPLDEDVVERVARPWEPTAVQVVAEGEAAPDSQINSPD
jgi:DNA helicase HerA-like ATPase